MQESLGRVFYASENSMGQFWRFNRSEDHGELEAWPKGLRFVGRKMEFSFLNVKRIETIIARFPWLGAICLGLAFVSSPVIQSFKQYKQLAAVPQNLGFLEGFIIGTVVTYAAMIILFAWIVRRFAIVRWAGVTFVDGGGESQRAYFTQVKPFFANISGRLPYEQFLKRIRLAARGELALDAGEA
jgi:hypothetical protein